MERLELLAIGADADADLQPAVAEMIERRDLLRHDDNVRRIGSTRTPVPCLPPGGPGVVAHTDRIAVIVGLPEDDGPRGVRRGHDAHRECVRASDQSRLGP